jgi:glutamine synthetase
MSEIKRRIVGSKVAMIGVSYVDLGGVTRDKPMASSAIDTVLAKGIKTARANLALNSLDGMTPDSAFNIAQGDISIVPDPSTFVIPSYSPESGRFIGDIYEADGAVSKYCPRAVCRRMIEQGRKLGYRPFAGFESEFHLVTRRGSRIVPADMSAIQSQAGYDLHHTIIQDFLTGLRSVNLNPIKAHVEGGKGQLEIDMQPEKAMKSADDFVYFKDAIRAIGRQHGLTASSMPKIGHGCWGSGLHLHFSLLDNKGRNLFYDDRDERKLGLSRQCYYFVGGLLEHLRALCAFAAPTVNSYKRLLPGKWNADAAIYGLGHRGAAIRIPDERLESTRVEIRIPDNACNLYLVLACVLAAGLAGIKEKRNPGDPVKFDTSPLNDKQRTTRGLWLLPRSLEESVRELEADELFRRALGSALLDEYIRNRRSEIAEFADRVTDWEVDHFLEVF